MKKIKAFHIYLTFLFIFSVSYIALVLHVPLMALILNQPTMTFLFSLIFLLFLLLFLLSLYNSVAACIVAYKIKRGKYTFSSNNTPILVEIAVQLLSIFLICFFIYSTLDRELSARGYESVLLMTEESERTQCHYEKIAADHPEKLTINDLSALLQTHRTYLNERKLQEEMDAIDSTGSKKSEIKQTLLHSRKNCSKNDVWQF